MTQVVAEGLDRGDTARGAYLIDGRASRFTVRAFASGLLSAMGHDPTIAIRDFGGGVEFRPDRLEAGSLRMVVKATSLSVQDDINAKDSREIERIINQEVLETGKFAEIIYEAPRIRVDKTSEATYAATLDGQLTLHGVTRDEPVVARVVLLGSTLRASGDFLLKQSNFNIRPISVAGGALKVKDELKFAFEIVARSQP